MKTLRQVLKGLVLAIVLSILLISGMILRNSLSRVSADRVDKKTDQKTSPIRDKDSNTAKILEKEAWWTDQEAYEANLLLKVNGSSLSGPMDVIKRSHLRSNQSVTPRASGKQSSSSTIFNP
ncbi:hypothetical protein NGA84_09000 [Lactococcus formosensis]|uniref:Uncharacterized protein n=1 Tax=Lactococcus formosensis TaxID=1281486 RepID=A0A9X4PD94_9LACT|nr:hypothetical protein [Lactococcus formosensis]MDG6143472.1 hypothetical protein [Lactococcus formosensis]MDG6160201.1 hypothetical protein [Lactococcus formosensis]MDG6166405.1 hypothetical protein [Lactococcus formosensis]MDG6172905.1 hypothetical protein [Lactococcus formosensis]MDG6193696.1 hypothetical protein [Lactococcus formosensis]